MKQSEPMNWYIGKTVRADWPLHLAGQTIPAGRTYRIYGHDHGRVDIQDTITGRIVKHASLADLELVSALKAGPALADIPPIKARPTMLIKEAEHASTRHD